MQRKKKTLIFNFPQNKVEVAKNPASSAFFRSTSVLTLNINCVKFCISEIFLEMMCKQF